MISAEAMASNSTNNICGVQIVIGYTTEFNNNIRINFDSDENVQKNYQGTIIYMSLYTVVFRYCEK